MNTLATADWYFDFISPYSYFALHRLDELRDRVEVRLCPVLFAALLDHHGQKGPAEIPSKRVWTYRHCVWYANRHNIPFRAPAAHPFNPLPWLRMALAVDGEPAAVGKIFRALWTTGVDPADPDALESLARSLNVDTERLSAPEVKEGLKKNSANAIEAGVFGVPTLVMGGELFWGVEGMDVARDYLTDPDLFGSAEMRRISSLPSGASRRRAGARGEK